MLLHRVALIRGALFAAIALCLAMMAARAAWIASLSRTSPGAALRWDSSFAPALVADNDLRLLHTGGAIDPVPFAAAARRALRSDPLNAPALRQVGLAADATNDHDGARRLIELGNRVSRRDLGIHIWTIEDRVNSGDIPGALDAYDLAMTISNDAPGLLYPVLGGALDDAAIRAAFAPYLGRDRPWMPGFLNYAIVTSAHPETLAGLFERRGGLPPDDRYRPLERQLLGQLLAKARYEAAIRYVLSLREVREDQLTNAGFTAQTTDPALAALGWQLSDSASVQVSRDRADGITLIIDPNTRNVAARRIMILPPGRYRFAHIVERLSQVEPASLTWEMQCLTGADGKPEPLWQQEIPAAQIEAPHAETITIPARCRALQLSLTITGRDSQASSGVRIGHVSLRPLAT